MYRTCKRWNKLIKEPLLWQTVNFWEGTNRRIDDHLTVFRHAANFPLNAKLALQVLQIYPKTFLKRVYLHVINLEILHYLTRYCTSLTTLSFFYTSSNKLARAQGLPTFVNDDLTFHRHVRGADFDLEFSFPASILELQLTFEFRYLPDKNHRRRDQRRRFYLTPMLLHNIIRCYNLRHLTLAYCRIDDKQEVDILIIETLRFFCVRTHETSTSSLFAQLFSLAKTLQRSGT